MTSAYEINRKKNRPKFSKNREKFGTEFMDDLEESAVGKFFDLSGEKKAAVDQARREGKLGKVPQFIQKAEDKVGEVVAPVLKPVGSVLGKISDVTQIDERISTPLTFVAAGAAAKGISKIKPKHLGITQTIEPYKPPKGLGKVPRKTVNITNQVEEALTTPSFTVQEIVKVAKKNKISYAKAAEYLKLKKQGIVPTQSINPGTNAGLLKQGEGPNDPVVYIPPEERIGTQKGDPLQMKFDPSIRPEQPIDPGDIPNIDLSTMIEPIKGKEPKNILNILNQNGMRGGRVDIFAYRAAGKDRKAVEYYLSPYSKMVKFDPIRNNIIAAMNRKYGGKQDVLGLGEKRSFQAHHVVPLKASFPAFHGIVKESPKYEYYMGLYADAVLSLGNQIENIVPAIGAVDRDFDAPHHLVHMMMEEVMGKAGEKFWDDTTLESLVVRDGDGKIIGTRNDEMRERLILKQIELFKRGEDIIKLGMEEYSLFQTNTAVPPEQIVDYFISQYGTPNLPTDLKYQPQLIKKITRDAIQDFQNTHVPSVVGGTLDLDTLLYLRELANRPPDWWRSLNVQQKKAQMPSITETVKGTANGYTFEQLDAYVDAGWMSQETLDKLFNPPKFESVDDIIKDVFPND